VRASPPGCGYPVGRLRGCPRRYARQTKFFAVYLYATLYLQQVLGLSAIEAGLVYLPGTVIMFVVAGATSTLGERVSPRAMVGVGLLLVAAGMALMTTAGVGSSWTAVEPGAIIAMIGTGLFNPAVTTLALGSVPAEQSGLAAGVNDTFRQGGIAVGVAALGALVPAGAALGGGSAQAYVDGLHDALWAGSGLAAAGAVAALVLIRSSRDVRQVVPVGELVPEAA
jgi:MFS family permease